MKKIVLLTLALICMAASAHADMPSLLLHIKHTPALNSLVIFSSIEWNQEALNKEKLAEQEIFWAGLGGDTLERNYTLDGKRIKVEMTFPRPETGRRLNESTRAELSLYEEGRLFFQTAFFGQPSDEFTPMPASGIKFRPNQIRLFAPGSVLKAEVSGTYGEADYHSGTEFTRAMRFEQPVSRPIDDAFMEELTGKLL